jgi:O-antigen/teichoic acid export membrane protein
MAVEGSQGTRSGAVKVVIATAIGGGSGYVLTVIAGKALGAEGYATFAVFWSALYLVISAISGIQQEVARATHPVEPGVLRPPVARNFALFAATLILLIALVTSAFWSPAVFPTGGASLVVPLAVGLAFYAVVAVLSGVFYGLELWRFIAAMISIDGLMRLAIFSVVILFTHDLVPIAWGIVTPFVVTPALVWFFARRRVVSRFELDVGYRTLTWNVARTIVGAAATGILISGFPLLLGATSASDSRASIAALIFATNLTRAPIVIVVLALQSYLVIFFRTRLARVWPSIAVIAAAIAGVTGVVTLLVALLGPWALGTFFGADYVLPAGVLAALVSSAGAVALLCATGPALLALQRHGWYTAGWVAAAAVTVGMLILPLPLTERTILALWVGPVAGLLVHGLGMLRPRPLPSEAVGPTAA